MPKIGQKLTNLPRNQLLTIGNHILKIVLNFHIDKRTPENETPGEIDRSLPSRSNNISIALQLQNNNKSTSAFQYKKKWIKDIQMGRHENMEAVDLGGLHMSWKSK